MDNKNIEKNFDELNKIFKETTRRNEELEGALECLWEIIYDCDKYNNSGDQGDSYNEAAYLRSYVEKMEVLLNTILNKNMDYSLYCKYYVINLLQNNSPHLDRKLLLQEIFELKKLLGEKNEKI